jgi:hypothetical protein
MKMEACQMEGGKVCAKAGKLSFWVCAMHVLQCGVLEGVQSALSLLALQP